MKIAENRTIKVAVSPDYNYVFNKDTGYFARWGKTKDNDPTHAPCGPEIADIEVSTICHRKCDFCYKSNTSKGKNMSFETFKKVFANLPKTLTQIAFGIGSLNANPDLFEIMDYSRKNGVIPNITINGDNLDDIQVQKLTKTCGAIAVSRYEPKDVCYNAVEKLTARDHLQINIHAMLAMETYDQCFQVVRDSLTDDRLSKLNAIVFLLLKPKGNRNNLHKIASLDKYKRLIAYAMKKEVNIGFDSCSAPIFLKSIKDHKDYDKLSQYCESCESTLFSIYINVNGEVFPCSFLDDGNPGIDVTKNKMSDIWNSDKIVDFRNKLINNVDENNCRMCPAFDIY